MSRPHRIALAALLGTCLALPASADETKQIGYVNTAVTNLGLTRSHRVVVERFNDPFVVDGHQILMRPSVGVAVAPAGEPDVDAQTLIKRADMAMYTAKKSRSSD